MEEDDGAYQYQQDSLIPIIERQIKRTAIKPDDAGYEGGAALN